MKDSKLIETGLDNVFILEQEGSKRLVTKNLTPGIQVYGEKLVTVEHEEYRLWDPNRSKLAAMILKGSSISLKKDASVLYLGAANGTTPSHVSDIVAEGTVFAVEFSPRAMHDLIRVSIPRLNLIPILSDAMHPNSYRNMVSQVDFLYQDVAQREQARIAIRNADLFLKKEGVTVLIIKSRSIDSVKKTKEVIDNEINKLEGVFQVLELINLEPYHSDHVAVVAQKIG
ncbi:MAG: fibrillarin-like rRNA/tRNA 2'-O-methyltransferase [Candidatus Methanoperedens sp.]|nr:fibrillarin-like rRNA/tRNA 2'-O-methyltransferase [Candidatus Methanoperedens sp.]